MRRAKRRKEAPPRTLSPRRERAFEGRERCRFEGVLYRREDARVEDGYRAMFEARIWRLEGCSDS